ncbi:PrgI family mobile element protein [Streptococcus sp. zg-JUN1979]|uniref:PrgI family mobile element protein n=1 Tax=Streptococcus sp. zg-JUN1979 TaxID=3391450 RepID=UPI0039AFEBCE
MQNKYKLGSEFLKRFDDYERPIMFGFTLRQVVLLLGIILVSGITIAISLLGLSKLFIYLVAFLLSPPFIIYGIGKDETIRDRLRFMLRVQKRGYVTEFQEPKVLSKDDFKNWNKVTEYN